MDRSKRHSLSDIVVRTLCGALCAVDNWVELERLGGAKLKWFRTLLDLPNGVPSHDRFGRVLSLLDPDEFRRCFSRWVESLGLVEAGDVVAILFAPAAGGRVRRGLGPGGGHRGGRTVDCSGPDQRPDLHCHWTLRWTLQSIDSLKVRPSGHPAVVGQRDLEGDSGRWVAE